MQKIDFVTLPVGLWLLVFILFSFFKHFLAFRALILVVSNDFVTPEVEKRGSEMLLSAGTARSEQTYANRIATPTFE